MGSGVGADVKLCARADSLRKRLDELKATKDAREGEQAGMFTTEELTEFQAKTAELAVVKKQLEAVDAENAVQMADYLKRRGVKPGEQADGKGATFDDGVRITDQSTGHFKTFTEQLGCIRQACMPGGQADERLLKVGISASGGSANVGADGGFLIEPQLMPGIMEHAMQLSQVYGMCPNITIGEGAGSLKYQEWQDYDQSAGLTWGGVQVFWAAEKEAGTVTSPKMEEAELKLHKLIGLTTLTNEQLEDSPSVEGLWDLAFTKAISIRLDEGVIAGTGAGQMLGILNSPALVSVPKESGQGKTVVAENIINMWGHVPPRLYRSLAWLIGIEVQTQLPSMQIGTGVSGQLVYMPPGGLSGLPYGTIYGRPVIPIADCKKLGDKGDIILAALGDGTGNGQGEYLTISKGNAKRQVSMHVYFLTDQQAYRWTMRVNGQPMWKKPVTPKNVTAGFLVSPFVTLQAR